MLASNWALRPPWQWQALVGRREGGAGYSLGTPEAPGYGT
jgi:hypothetical protein